MRRMRCCLGKLYGVGLITKKGPLLTSSILAVGRASGGPVFNSNGFVMGVNSKSFAEAKGLLHSTTSSIREIEEILIDGITVSEFRIKALKNWPNLPVAIRRIIEY